MTRSDDFSAPRKPVVLIVEDDELLRSLLVEVIADTGADVEAVTTAEDGLSALKQRSDIELLLTDVKTPGCISGWDLAKAACEQRPHLPVIIMSGYSFQPGAELPPNACFVQKPCSLDTLCCLVKTRLMLS
jgi:DNA-binding NtrC family response regulator